MKKNKKSKLYKFIFMMFFLSFLVIYISEITGYYEYRNYQKKTLTEEQIKKFEEDVANGKEVDIDKYLVIDNSNYSNKLSDVTSKLSDSISAVVGKGVTDTFKFLSKFIEE